MIANREEKISVVDDKVEFRRMLSLNSKEVKLVSKNSVRFRKRPEEREEMPENMKRLAEQCEVVLKVVQNSCTMIEEFLTKVEDNTVVTEKHRQRLGNQKRVLQIRQTQLLMVLFIIQNRHKDNFLEEYSRLFVSLDRFRIQQDHVMNKLNFRMLDTIHNKELTYLRFYERNISELIDHADDCDFGYVNFKVKRCKVLISKIYTCAQLYPFGCMVSQEDLFSEDLNQSKRWAALKKVMTIRILGDKKSVQTGFGFPIEGMNVINAMMSKINELSQSIDPSHPDNFLSVLRGGFHVLNYAVIKEKAQRRAQLFLSDPDQGLAADIWNLPESSLARPFLDLVMPSIKYVEVINIPRHFPQLTFDVIQKWAEKGSYNMPEESPTLVQRLTDIRNYTRKLFQDCDNIQERIHVRVMSPVTIERVMKERSTLKDMFRKIFHTKPPKPIKKIIMHVHGGGFVSQTSYFHQLYTRNWANNIGVPIYSVDYRLAPDHPYPAALDDCFQVYMWLTHYLHKVFDVTPEDIVLVGDSAGGNIITALTGLLIKLNQRLPGGIVLIYPTLNLTFNSYSPSLLASLDDPILPHTYLKLCLSSYLPEDRRAVQDPFASPIKFGDDILRHFPPTRIFIGNKDPFHDDNCRLAEKLMKLKRDIRLTIYDNFTHAFLQLEFPFQELIYSRIAINEIEGALKELLKMEEA